MLKQTGTIREQPVYCRQYDLTFIVRKAKDENCRHELANLARRKIDHGGDLPSDKRFRRIVARDLGRTFQFADVGSEIEPQLDRRLPSLGESCGAENRSCKDINLQENIEIYRHRYLHRQDGRNNRG